MPRHVDQTWEVSDSGHLPLRARLFLSEHLQLYAGGPVRIRVSRPQRTTKANAYYWGVVLKRIHEAALEAGAGYVEVTDPATGEARTQQLTAEVLHYYFKRKYLPCRTATIGGEEVVMEPTTTTLDQTGFHYYLESIKHDELTIELGVFFDDEDLDFRSYRIAEPELAA